MVAAQEETQFGPPSRWLALAGAYAVAAVLVYRRAFSGGLVSDDIGYLMSPWVRRFDGAALAAVFDPWGLVAAYTANYAPLHVLGHALAVRAFGDAFALHHLVNVLLHAAASALVAALLVRAGLAFAAAAFVGAVFLLHPANVEAVAWISQLKSVLALVLACTALLLEPQRPVLALLAFAGALLTKFQAAFALPVAGLLIAQGRPAGAAIARGRRLAWLCTWALALVLVSLPQMHAFERLGHVEVSAPEGLAARGRFLFALVGRYAAMATTSWGVSAFHQPDPPTTWADGWVLLGAAATAAAGARALVALVRREEEAVFWAWAAGALLPVSQLLPFLYPLADRYLYFALPGLLGALVLAARPFLERALAVSRGRMLLAATTLALLLVFAARSDARAVLWRSNESLALDAAAHYPAGISARRLEAAAAARRGDVDATVAALRAARARGFDGFRDLEIDPGFDALRDDARFRAVVAEVAGAWISAVERREAPTPQEKLMLGQAHRARGEWDLALARLAEAAADPGPTGAEARAELVETRVARIRAERGASGEGDHGAPPR